MDEQLQKAMADIFVVVKDAATFTAAQAQGQLPVLVEEYLRWGALDAALGIVYWGLLGMFGYRCIVWAQEDRRSNEAVFAGYLIGGASALVSFIAVGINVSVLVQVLVAPRVYLLETLARLVQ